jgi:hypothetical protein
MDAKDKISKTAWQLFEAAKDVVKANVVNAVKSKQVMVEAASVQTLLLLIDASLDEGYHRGHGVFSRSVGVALAEAVKAPPVVVKTVVQPTATSKKK